MRELINLRKKREKHFLNPDGTITCHVYDKDIHYLKNGIYEEIDNTLVDIGDHYENKSNSFRTLFTKNSNDLVNVRKDEHYLKMYLNTEDILHLDKINENIKYKNLKNNIDFDYKILSSKLKESIILNCRETVPETLEFFVETDLKLNLQENKKISAKSGNEIIFTIDAPFMIDARGNANYCVDYEVQEKSGGYLLKVILDVEWLKDKDTVFPVTVDPTIINGTGENVYDTYITSADPTATKNFAEQLYLGVEENDVRRILLKFTLPEIGTGFDIIDAKGYITTHEGCLQPNPLIPELINTAVHEITVDWDETTANWESMNDKFSPIIEDVFYPFKNQVTSSDLAVNEFNITNLVKRWYAGKPNYGVMLKWHKETYDSEVNSFRFYSKTYDINNSSAYRAYMTITYRNQNGLEDYMTYNCQKFINGAAYINNLTGNLTVKYSLNKSTNGIFPIDLNLFYNTNDVVLSNSYGYGIGIKLNYHQTIKEIVLENKNYLEYVDEDGTIHYLFYYNGMYEDEDGLGLKANLVDEKYEMQTKNNYKYTFTKVGEIYYLTEIKDCENNIILINYDSSNRVVKIVDFENNEVNIEYTTDKMLISNNNQITTINYSDETINSIINNNGTTVFSYNIKGLIEKISGSNGFGYQYDYYDIIPYRIKQVSELGLNDAVGKSLVYEYGFCTTKIIDNKGRYTTYTFNSRGNTICITNLNGEENLDTAYGNSMYYFDDENNIDNDFINRAMNKLNQASSPIKFTKNLINNSSFEDECENRSNEASKSGNYAYKISGTASLEYVISPGKYYTFSGYFKNTEKIVLSSYLTGISDTVYNSDVVIDSNNEFNRYDFTFYADETRTIFGLEFLVDNNGIAFMDDIQLEEGKVANYYNLIQNADFTDDFNNWTISSSDEEGNDLFSQNEIVTLECGTKYAKLIGGPDIGTSMSQYLNISGKKGDIYHLSFWYKNTGIVSSWFQNYASVLINFNYPDDFEGYGEPWMDDLNYHASEWQFYSGVFVAEDDYEGFYVDILFLSNANNLNIANVVLSKDIENDSCGYDYDTGNLTAYRNMSGNEINLVYDEKNQLTNIFESSGVNYKYEYDNNNENRILRAFDSAGIVNEIKYDEKGNPVKSIIKYICQNLGDEQNCYIRLKGTTKYFDCNFSEKKLLLKELECNPDLFKVEKYDNAYYYFKFGNYYLIEQNNIITFSKILLDEALFSIISLSNGSYLISPKNKSNYCIGINENNVELILKNEEDYNQQFYLEIIGNEKFIDNEVEYLNNKFVSKVTDSLGHSVSYEIDEIKELITAVINPKGIKTNYIYNNKNQIIEIALEEKKVYYEYNDNNLISYIRAGEKTYSFEYNEFLKLKIVKVNEVPLITNNYELNNGNLISAIYGNNNSINYEYDYYDRLSKITYQNVEYNIIYDNMNNISKIISNKNKEYKYNFDISNRLSKYSIIDVNEVVNNYNLIVNYDYNVSNDLTSVSYDLNVNDYSTNYSKLSTIEYNYSGNLLSQILFDNKNIIYSYDNLNRLVNKNINGLINLSYDYLSKGNKTSFRIKNNKIDDDLYSYNYDELYNITDVFLNNKIINHYEYDKYNQLTKSMDYLNGINKIYNYNLQGNILKIQTLNMNDVLLSYNIFNYDNSWDDRLIKFNEELIEYDNSGNPIKIGSKNLNWINGKNLVNINDSINNIIINYEYDLNGYRVSKTINGTKTYYYLEHDKIIFERTGNNIIYYIRDNQGNVIGMKYNDTAYYYVKNIFDDVIAIKDDNNSIVAKYSYDDYGNILSIVDGNANIIVDQNHIAMINPFRYRSYYYDKESNFYYLGQRYYNPLWGRFINADVYITENIGSTNFNMFAYCYNNPISFVDNNGNFGITSIIFTVVGVAAASLIAANNQYWNEKAQEEINEVQKNNSVIEVDGRKMCKMPTEDKAFKKTLEKNAAKAKKETKGMNYPEKLLYLVNNANDGDVYDIKLNDEWSGNTIYYDGYYMEAQDLGNYQFGYITAAIGIDSFVSTKGAGIQQVLGKNRNLLWCTGKSLCDDPRDTMFIELGALRYEKDHPKK